jgi:hypothetical protein
MAPPSFLLSFLLFLVFFNFTSVFLHLHARNVKDNPKKDHLDYCMGNVFFRADQSDDSVYGSLWHGEVW